MIVPCWPAKRLNRPIRGNLGAEESTLTPARVFSPQSCLDNWDHGHLSPTLLLMYPLVVFLSRPLERIGVTNESKYGVREMTQEFKSMCCSYNGLKFNPQHMVKRLMTTNSSSSLFWTLWLTALMCANPHTHVYIQVKIFLEKNIKLSSEALEITRPQSPLPCPSTEEAAQGREESSVSQSKLQKTVSLNSS